jgi:glucose-6-phosphate dehydrogenase assembly protein OpcA
MNATSMMVSDNTETIHVRDIQQVLQHLWREASGDDGDNTIMQVRTLNFVVFVSQDQATPDLHQTISNVAVQHPGRTITLVAASEPQPTQAHVSIACRLGEVGRHICGEHITITGGHDGAPLPSVVAPLLVAGLPVFLLWHGDPPFGTPIFEALVENADRIIVDGRTWLTPLATLRALDQYCHEKPYAAYTDLLWAALTTWRHQIAQCFDLPDAAPHLHQLEQVEIELGNNEHDYVAALLLIGWLASSLRWSIVHPEHDRIMMQTGNDAISCTLRQQQHLTGIQTITLQSQNARFMFRHLPGNSCVRTIIDLDKMPVIERVIQPTAKRLDELIGDELMVLQRDRGYMAALRIAAQLAANLAS